MKNIGTLWLVQISFLILSACIQVQGQVKAEHLRLTPESFARRQLQTRVYDTENESEVLASCSAVLQDIGFLVDESEVQLGLIVASKERSAIQPAEVTAQVMLAILLALSGNTHDPVWDEKQIMRISLVVTPSMAEQKGTAVRITFQRIVFTNKGTISKRETLGTPAIYQEFFDKLSKALFLEAQKL